MTPPSLHILFLVASSAALAAEPTAMIVTPASTPGWRFEELRRIPAAEARQGVAADESTLIAINNHALGQYRKDTGVRTAGWECPAGDPLTHLNAGIVHMGKLYCAHSNYPGVPNLSSVEIWDAKTLQHVGSHSFGRADGSFTWIERRHNRWLACFVHYGKKGGEPGRGPEWTRLVEFDDEWRETGGWALPADLIVQLGARGYSCSGGAIGPGEYLYVTGHDDPQLYVLAFPTAGPTLRWVATIPIPAHGQAFAWDPQNRGLIYLLARETLEIIVGRITTPILER
ncbi:MAG: hypothetical protein SGI92_33745 [Bryobacteraceae bacterium]|nr:hypothetical protein [Bryobacteraceae bacterium]